MIVPSWTTRTHDSETTVLHRVEVGVQSPAGTTTKRAIFRRYSEFVKLDRRLAGMLGPCSLALCNARELPPLPPKTFWQKSTCVGVVQRRWGALQQYLDGVLDLISLMDVSSSAWLVVREFLSLPEESQ